MLVTHSERPRELKWYHAGPMLYGDWGTSRFYVLGLALFYALHASFWYVFAVGALVAAVGWAYTIICRCYPDGGGVYSAAKHTNRQLAVVGALLLFADYIVTASISAYDGIRYMGVAKEFVPYIAMGAILAIGFINYIGPKKAGTVALVITMATLVLTTVLAAFSIPHLKTGWAAIHTPVGNIGVMWTSFVGVVLALSGVEAIANMTGIMVPPVTKTANKAIWPVLIEVVVLNLILAVAMNGLPKSGYDLGTAPADVYEQVEHIKEAHPTWSSDGAAREEFGTLSRQTKMSVPDLMALERSPELKRRQDDTTDAVLRVMAHQYVDPYLKYFGLLAGVVFGLLLLSAVNTAVADMVSIQYVMSRDTELPHVLTKLNMFGVPWYALIAAVGLPIGLLCIFQDVYALANLYAVGVVGAIAINLGSCSFNREMPVKKLERTGLGILAVILVVIEATLIYQKPDARYFAAFVLFSGMAARFFTKTYPKFSFTGRGYSLVAWACLLVMCAAALLHFEDVVTRTLHENVVLFQFKYGPQPHYATYMFASFLLMAGGTSATYGVRYLLGKVPGVAAPAPALALVGKGAPPAALPGTAATDVEISRPHVLVATRGAAKLLEFAANYCHKTGAIMFVLFVRQINVTLTGAVTAPNVAEDPEALKAFESASAICKKHGVQMLPIYAISADVSYTILDFAATYGVESVLMGVSRQGAMLRALRGDVISAVADNLPEDISLLVHA